MKLKNTYFHKTRWGIGIIIFFMSSALSAQSLASRVDYPFKDYEQLKRTTSEGLNPNKLSISQALDILKHKFEVNFSYLDDLNSMDKISASALNEDEIDPILLRIFKNTRFQYKEVDLGFYVIYKSSIPEGSLSEKNTTKSSKQSTPTQRYQRTRSIERLPDNHQAFRSIKKLVFTVSGTVTDQEGEPLIGVNVLVKGTNKGVSTGFDGKFELEDIDENAVLVFSYIGYKKMEVSVKGKSKIDVALISDSQLLDEVVVVGYGTQKKSDILGAVQSVKPEDLTNTSSNLSTAFAGNIAGLIATQKSGEPGYDGASYYIRGIATFGANRSPLLMLDGVEITSAMLNNIPPESIESFSILKDATATALYGSRGANGVMIITTKEGHASEKVIINARLENTVSMPTFVQGIADGPTYMNLYNEAVKNNTPSSETYTPFYSKEKIDGTMEGLHPYIFPNNDWYHTMFKDQSMNQSFNFNMSGGTKKIDYFLNMSFFNENGIIKEGSQAKHASNINNQKYLFQSNVSSQLTETTRVGLKMNTQLWYNNRPRESISNLFYYSMRANPVRFPATLPSEEGDTYVRYGNNNSWDVGPIDLNPYAILNRGFGNRYYSYLTSVLTVDQDLGSLVKGLSAKVLASFYNYTYSARYRNIKPFYFKVKEDYDVNPDGSIDYETESIGDPGNTYLTSSVGRSGHHEYSAQGSLNYNRLFGAQDIGAMLVFRIKERVLNTPSTSENDLLPFREEGVAGRFTYYYDRRYLIEANFGYNGSENFISGKRFGFFPSVAVGYTLSNEEYFKRFKNVVNLFKIRSSYGLVGNDALSFRFPYLTTVSMDQSNSFWRGVNFSSTRGPRIDVLGNENATWEEVEKFNVGLDLELVNALSLTIDYFQENRTGIFMQRESLPTSVGLAGTIPYANIGAVKNSGVDFTLEYHNNLSKDFRISTRGTFTYAHNEVTEKDEPELLYSYTSVIGHPINTIFGFKSAKLFESQGDIESSPEQTISTYDVGDIKYEDLNGDGKIDGNDITAIGSPTIPEIIYGLNSTLNFKKWDLSLMFQGASRVSLLMSNMHPFADAGKFGFNITQYIADDHWSESNPDINASYPRLSPGWNENNVKTSTFWVKNASYLRFKNAELGYRVNSRLRLYLAGTNLFYFSPFKYWDPEMGSGNGLNYPLQRTVKIGVHLHF